MRALAGLPNLSLPSVPEGTQPAWHQFVVQHPRRDALQNHLTQRGIGTLIHYPVPPHLSEAYADLGLSAGALPVTEGLARTVLSLPMGPHLTEDQVEAVVQAIMEFEA
jgi:dTDP-4-amino-4,6-dideoxygalactose transaminase